MAIGDIHQRAVRRLERTLGDRLGDAPAAAIIGLTADPRSNPRATIAVARRLEARGGRSRAIKLLRDAMVHYPSEAALLYELGFLLERDRRIEDAIDAYTASIERSPSAQSLYRRGKCHQLLEEHSAASADFAHALRFDGQDFRIHRALFESSQGEPLWRRLEILDDALYATDVDDDWKITLASVRYSMGHFAEAAALYEALDSANPQDRFALRHVECLYLAGDHMGARQEFRRRAPSFKSRERAQAGLGGYLQSLGRWSDAGREYERVLGSSPTPQAMHRCGYAYLRSHEYDAAFPMLLRASRSQAAPASWVFHEGMCLEKMGRYEDAIRTYLWAYAQGGTDYHLYRAVSCARTLDSQELSDLVAEHLRSRIVGDAEADPDRSMDPTPAARERLREAKKRGARVREAKKRGAREALREIGVEARRQGRLDEALPILRQLCDTEEILHPKDHVELAAVYAQLGDVTSAFDAYLESRPFRTAHGLDESNLPPTLDRNHAIYIDFSEHLPVDQSKVLYESNHGSALTCNVLPLLRKNLETGRGSSQQHVVVLDDAIDPPHWLQGRGNVLFVRRGGHAYLKHLATAGWLINNNTFPPYFSRRQEQRYLNTWHGTPLKSLGRDIRSGMMDHRNAARNLLHATHLAMPNLHTARVLVDRYDVSGLYTGKLALTGSPRVDSTIRLAHERDREIRAALPDKPIVVYAPTWRGTLADRVFDTQRLVDDLTVLSKLPIHLIFKPHPITEELLRDVDLPSNAPPVGVDTNELLAVTDVLLTDYSSILFDFYPLARPTILYAYDEEEYFRDRGAYFELDQLPGQVCRFIEDVEAAIRDSLAARAGLTPGVVEAAEFCRLEDGGATDRVLSFLFDDADVCEIGSRFSKEDREEVLFFSGSFIPNGITNSFSALTEQLIETEKYNTSVVLQPEAVFSDPQRLEKFAELPEDLRAFGRVGSMAATAEEQWLIDRFNSLHGFFSREHERLVLRAFRREFHRLFGCAQFDHVVCFEGYARFWAVLMAAAKNEDTSTHIYLHSDMAHERSVRFRYLDGIFALYASYDSLISVSESVNDVNRHKLSPTWGIDPTKMIAVRNMIDIADIRERAAEGEKLSVPWDDGTKVFVSTGRLTPEKGHQLLLEAFANVAETRDDVALIVVGDGPLMVQMRGFVAARGLSDRVLLPGYMSNPLGVVAQGDCFVFPSRYEGQGLSLVEGLTLGLPGIGTDVVGVRSVLADGEGLLVDLSVEGLEKGLLTFVDEGPMGSRVFDPERYVRIAIKEFEAALRNH